MNLPNAAFLMLAACSFRTCQAQAETHRWINNDACCTSAVNAGTVSKSIMLDGGKLGVKVGLQEFSGMLLLWVAVVTNRLAVELKPNDFRILVIAPTNKEVAPIPEWQLNTLRIGNKVRLRKTPLSPGNTANGYVLFPNEKKREHVLVELPISDMVLEFPFDFAPGAKDAR